jgi:hypothetical protein
MQSPRLTRSIRRDMLSPALAVSTAPGMASNDQTVSSISRRVNGEWSCCCCYAYLLTDATRYSNMDFALLSTLMPSLKAGISRVLISYDIGCQWHKNLQARLDDYTAFPPLQLSDLEYWRVVVPKFHLSAHGAGCQVVFNLSFTKWARRMDGERIESGWAQSNPMATWTRESGPNARRNILDDHWNASNWGKLLGLREYYYRPSLISPLSNLFRLGTSLEKSLRRSLAWSKSQREAAKLMSGSFETAIVDSWRKMREAFDLDQTKPNPYEEVDNRAFFPRQIFLFPPDWFPDVTMAKLKLDLLKEEAKESSGRAQPHKVSAGAFFRKAIEIEGRR